VSVQDDRRHAWIPTRRRVQESRSSRPPGGLRARRIRVLFVHGLDQQDRGRAAVVRKVYVLYAVERLDERNKIRRIGRREKCLLGGPQGTCLLNSSFLV